jgi:ribosome-associated protein
MSRHDFQLRGDFIALNDLLKTLAIASSGGAAKQLIAQGLVKVDGAVELRKTAKIRAGQLVWALGEEIVVRGAVCTADSAL